MLATFSLVIGILLAIIVLAAFRNRPAALAWWTLFLGLAGAAALLGAMGLSRIQTRSDFPLWLASILFAAAAVIIGIQALRKGLRQWPAWVGLVAGLAGIAFWAWFTIAELTMGG
jgi:hypothetical protein